MLSIRETFDMTRTFRAGLLLGFTIVLLAPRATYAQTPEPAVVLTTPHFAFYSDFNTNLNDALVNPGLARKNSKPELFRAGDEVACFEKLPASTRAAWDSAVDYYAKVISPAGSFGEEQYRIRADLAGFQEEVRDADAQQFIGIVRNFRAAAAPAYRACRWTLQNAKNRQWVDDVKPVLAADETKAVSRLESLYQQKWDGLPIRIDMVETVDWSGASTVLRDPVGGHILMSTGNPASAAFEVVFHEASHILMGRGAPIREALQKAATAANFTLPRDLWHVVLFYTTGEVVRRIVDSERSTPYSPMLYEIFARPSGDWTEYRHALETAWLPYVQGKRTLAQASANLIAAIQAGTKTKTKE